MKPIGALILSLQAISTSYLNFRFLFFFFSQVEHVFKSWKTGEHSNNGTASAHYFSSDNYGDHMVKK